VPRGQLLTAPTHGADCTAAGAGSRSEVAEPCGAAGPWCARLRRSSSLAGNAIGARS
jgi:hypothetical protein